MGTIRVAKRDSSYFKTMEKLFQLMEEENIQLSIIGSHLFVIFEDGKKFEVVDFENTDDSLTELPPNFEYKLKLVDENW